MFFMCHVHRTYICPINRDYRNKISSESILLYSIWPKVRGHLTIRPICGCSTHMEAHNSLRCACVVYHYSLHWD